MKCEYCSTACSCATKPPPTNLLSGSRFSRELSQSTRPTKIRERLVDLGVLKELYAKVAPILSVMNLGPEAIRYFAGSVTRMRTTDLRRRANDDIRVHLVAFIAHQYYRLNDNLVDVLLASVKHSIMQHFENTETGASKSVSGMNRATENLLDDLDTSVFQVLRQIRDAVADVLLSDKEKVERISLSGSAGANGGSKIPRTPRLPRE